MGRVPKRKEKEQDMHDIYDYIRGPKRTGSGNTQMYPRFRQLHLSTVFFVAMPDYSKDRCLLLCWSNYVLLE